MLNTVGRFTYTKYWGLHYVEHRGKVYLHKILRITLCWALWEGLFTTNTEDYLCWALWEDLLKQNTGITLCWILWEDLFTQNTGKYLCWTPSEDLFTQNTGKYVMLNTVGVFIYIQYWEVCYVEHLGKIYLHKILGNTLCWTLGIFFLLYAKYWKLLYVEHCEKIYLHKILEITWCWALSEDLFTQNTGEYFMLSTVGRFIYTKYRGILYVEHCGMMYLHKILGNTLCWTLWEYLFT